MGVDVDVGVGENLGGAFAGEAVGVVLADHGEVGVQRVGAGLPARELKFVRIIMIIVPTICTVRVHTVPPGTAAPRGGGGSSGCVRACVRACVRVCVCVGKAGGDAWNHCSARRRLRSRPRA